MSVNLLQGSQRFTIIHDVSDFPVILMNEGSISFA